MTGETPPAAKGAASERLQGWLAGTFAYTAYRGRAPDGVPQLRSDIRIALEAISTPASGGLSVKVKPLTWGEERRVPDAAWSKTMLRQHIGHHNLGPFAGSYSVQEMDAGGAWGWWNTWTSDRYPDGVEPTLEAAKAAAQADFNARILSALDRTTLPTAEGEKA